jgi:5-methylcytosine-specific restriction endonuclease McrA
MLRKAVQKKWHTAAEKEWWYIKYRTALRQKTFARFQQQGGLCFYCKNPCFMGEADQGQLSKKRMATAEHAIPSSKGGTDHLSNIVMACAACNHLRGDMGFDKFRHLRADPERWSNYCKEIQRRNAPRKAKIKEKRKPKQLEFMWKIALLLYVKPEWGPVVESIRQEFARRAALMHERNQRRAENSNVDETDILVDK